METEMQRPVGWVLLILVGLFSMIRIASAQDSAGVEVLSRFEKMVLYNLDNEHTLPSEEIDSLMSVVQGKPVGERIAFWADTFYKDSRARYLFGLDPGGYVTDGRIVDDFATDCVLFLYRTTELGRSSSAREAVQFAFGTRFFGASVDAAILPDGKVQYDHPSHLDYSEDILKSGIWGKDVTASIGPVQADPGSDRFPPGSFSYVPKEKVNFGALASGDIIFFVTDEKSAKGTDSRSGKGGLIGHIGIIAREGEEPYLIHAAKTPLIGFYEGGKIEKIPLKTYLDRIDSFKGIAVARIEEF
jgi:hypothetical protein